MKSILPNLLLSIFLGSSVFAAGTSAAQQRFVEDAPAYEYDRAGYEIFVDSRGRRFLIDAETGRVVGRTNPQARFTRRDRASAQRELKRAVRRERLNRELGSLFGLFDRSEERPQVRDRDISVRERPRRRHWFGQNDPLERGAGQNRIGSTSGKDGKFRDPAPSFSRGVEVARLPDLAPPVQKTPQLTGIPKPNYSQKQMAALQVVLDREGFSPGVIDGKWGSNVAKAIVSWKEAKGSTVDLGNARTLKSYVQKTGGAVLSEYIITPEDIAGPYVASVPVDYAKKAQLNRLSYTSVEEMLAEKFHMSLSYLQALNPGKNFRRAGTAIQVVRPGARVTKKVHYIIADKSRKQVRAYDRNGKLVTAYPATIGSSATPSPSGTHSVDRIAFNPEYTYNPKKNFQQGDNDKILRIPPGPNGPVGSVWIALSKPTYGIHGTPNPRTIGKTNSHGCIRLTNWDATELANLVQKGATVEFIE